MLKGTVKLNGDKSISHRILLFGALASGGCTIYNLSTCQDVQRTINILKNCNIKINKENNKTTVVNSIVKPRVNRFYCGNSGTTARFMLGFLPSIGVSGTIYGDKSLSTRPMQRLIEPLLKMNINIKTIKNHLPITFEKSKIKPISLSIKHPSAQIKTALIFAALSSSSKTIIRDPFNTRNHTENIIKYLNGPKDYYSKFQIKKFDYTVPGDISSASFIIAGALLIKGSDILIQEVLFNETRIGYIKILQKMGAQISVLQKRTINFETVADIRVQYTQNLQAVHLTRADIVNMIDEIPIFALISCFAKGTTSISHAAELRLKESDRIKSIVYNLKLCGGNVVEKPEGLTIKQSKLLYNTSIKSFHDHRIAMMCEILKLITLNDLTDDSQNNKIINTSFPKFYKHLRELHV